MNHLCRTTLWLIGTKHLISKSVSARSSEFISVLKKVAQLPELPTDKLPAHNEQKVFKHVYGLGALIRVFVTADSAPISIRPKRFSRKLVVTLMTEMIGSLSPGHGYYIVGMKLWTKIKV